MSPGAVIEFQNVSKRFGQGRSEVSALRDLSFVCPAGAFWSIMGPSGSGKSTILHVIAGLTPPSSGTVLVEGQNVARMSPEEVALLRRRRVGYVLQAFNLMPFLTAVENVAMPLVLDGVRQSEAHQRAEEALDLVKLAHRAHHKPSEMSGGEQQRIAVARALVIRPAIMLADEPTGNLDRGAGSTVMELIRDINERLHVTVLIVTHDPVFAAYAERILRIVDGQLQQDVAAPGGRPRIAVDR